MARHSHSSCSPWHPRSLWLGIDGVRRILGWRRWRGVKSRVWLSRGGWWGELLMKPHHRHHDFRRSSDFFHCRQLSHTVRPWMERRPSSLLTGCRRTYVCGLRRGERGTCWTVVLVGNCRVPIGSPEVAVEFAVVASRTRANIGTVWGYMAAVTKVVPRQLNFVKT